MGCNSKSEIRSKKLEVLYFFLLIFLLLPSISYSRPVIADLAIRRIDIDSSFTGTEVLLFGARNDPGDIVVVVRGPENTYVVRKKERVAGIWVNKEQQYLRGVNGFYAIASSRQLADVHNDNLLQSLNIGVDNISIHDQDNLEAVPGEFKEAFLKKLQADRLYQPVISDISFMGDTLFRTVIKFPDNIIRGVYTAEIYLFSDGQLSGMQSTPIIISKKGFDAVVYDLAYKYPALYGIIGVTFALLAGWCASIIFRRV